MKKIYPLALALAVSGCGGAMMDRQVAAANTIADATNKFQGHVKSAQRDAIIACVNKAETEQQGRACIGNVQATYKPIWTELKRVKVAHDVWITVAESGGSESILVGATKLIESYCSLRAIAPIIPAIPMVSCSQ